MVTSPTINLKTRSRTRKVPDDCSSSREGSAESNEEENASLDDDESIFSRLSSPTSIEQSLRDGPHSHQLIGGIDLNLRNNFNTSTVGQTAPTGPSSNAGRVFVGKKLGGNGFIGKLNSIETDGEGVFSEGSAGHDGDVSSTTTAPGPSTHRLGNPDSTAIHSVTSQLKQSSHHSLPHDHHESTVTTSVENSRPTSPHHSPIASRYIGTHGGNNSAPPAWAAAPQGFLSNLTPEDIQDHIRNAIALPDPGRSYKIMAPPIGRPVRIYADGVYDLLHYGHMLQLRQCKLAFPSVHLMVGVCSDELVRKYKASPVLTSAERYESVRHCKWVDEVVEDAPWFVDEEFFAQHRIDYVAHDEEPYAMKGGDDVYAYAKSIGAFLPTKRTNGVSTSELLQRIVEGYREGEYDNKFIKLGLPDLCSTRNQSEASSAHGDRVGTLTKGIDDVTVAGAIAESEKEL